MTETIELLTIIDRTGKEHRFGEGGFSGSYNVETHPSGLVVIQVFDGLGGKGNKIAEFYNPTGHTMQKLEK